MDLVKKLRMAMVEADVTQVELSRRTEQTQANLSKKMRLNNFNLREYNRLVEALGYELEINIVLPGGKRI